MDMPNTSKAQKSPYRQDAAHGKIRRMAKKRKPDRHKNPALNLRLHPILRQQLQALADRNLTTLTTEATAAIREYLRANGLWPPSETK